MNVTNCEIIFTEATFWMFHCVNKRLCELCGARVTEDEEHISFLNVRFTIVYDVVFHRKLKLTVN